MCVYSNNPNQPKKVLVPVSQPLTAETLQALSNQGLVKSGGMTADGKRIIVVKKSATGMFSSRYVEKTRVTSLVFYYIGVIKITFYTAVLIN